MKAITVSRQQGNLVWQQQERPIPQPQHGQYLVKLQASSVNPVDFKVASNVAEGQTSRVLGWDAVGEVVQAGPASDSSLLQQRVWYLGALAADGCQAEYQLVDADLVVPAPKQLSATAAASLPLTGLTAIELLLDKLGYQSTACVANQQRPLLLINGAGGVGSVLLQLCRLWQIPVTATASRAQSQQWCLQQGADKVIRHADLATLSAHQFAAVVCAHDTDAYFTDMTRLVAPFGQIIALSGAKQAHPVQLLMEKSASFGFEFVFTRSQFPGVGRARQQQLLAKLAELADQGLLMPTTTTVLDGLTADNLQQAHQALAAQQLIGKLVLAY